MSFRARLETHNNTVFPLLLPDGTLCGNALLTFIVPLALFCRGEAEPEVHTWFTTLEGEQPLCELVGPLLQSWYDGNWHYQEDEYDRYLEGHAHNPITEVAFRETVCALNGRWSTTQPLRASARGLLLLLTSEERTATWWYHPQSTPLELQALIDTIELAEESDAPFVRICFM